MSTAFLERAGWAGATETLLSPDFSPRRFARLAYKGRSAIFMQAGADQKTPAFVAIARLLRQAGLSAPEIYAEDAASGLVLMEDFGDGTLGARVDAGADPAPFFDRATDVLAALHASSLDPLSAPELPVFDAANLAALTEPFLDLYLPARGRAVVSASERADFIEAWRSALAFVDQEPRVLLLRDYMLDNLMDLPGRTGVASVGILDFQDGGWGPASYDLASLAEGVRRETSLARLDSVRERYRSRNLQADEAKLSRALTLIAAQRHVRLLGNFTRYKRLDIVERIEKYLDVLASQQEVAFLRPWLKL